MRLANADDRLCLVEDGQLVDVETASSGQFASDPMAVFPRWEEFTAWGAGRGKSAAPPNGIARRLGAPVPRPAQVLGTGANYVAHAAEANVDVPDYPIVFPKFVSCLAGPDEQLVIWNDQTDWEIELVVVIADRCWKVPAEEAWSHVAGLTIGQDISDRGIQWADPRLVFTGVGKSLPGYGPIGPWLVTLDEFDSPDDLDLTCRLNGELVQQANTKDLIHSVPELIAHMSGVAELWPGDLIFTGTPAGIGMTRDPPRYLMDGDVLTSSIEGIGTMTTTVVRPT